MSKENQVKTITWNGINRIGILNKTIEEKIALLFKSLKEMDWTTATTILLENPELINTFRIGSTSLYTPLHSICKLGADSNLVKKFIGMGAFISVRNANGKTPYDLIDKVYDEEAIDLTRPRIERTPQLEKLEGKLHRLINEETDGLILKHGLIMPPIEALFKKVDAEIWFPIPGMMGGFLLRPRNSELAVEVKYWSRMWSDTEECTVYPEG